MELGNKINSNFPENDVFITVEMIPLRPQQSSFPIVYPGNPVLCELNSTSIKSEGCELVSVNTEPQQCQTLLEEIDDEKIDETTIVSIDETTPLGNNDENQ